MPSKPEYKWNARRDFILSEIDRLIKDEAHPHIKKPLHARFHLAEYHFFCDEVTVFRASKEYDPTGKVVEISLFEKPLTSQLNLFTNP